MEQVSDIVSIIPLLNLSTISEDVVGLIMTVGFLFFCVVFFGTFLIASFHLRRYGIYKSHAITVEVVYIVISVFPIATMISMLLSL